MTLKYCIEVYTHFDGWIVADFEDHLPLTFATKEDALVELREILDDTAHLGYTAKDFRIAGETNNA